MLKIRRRCSNRIITRALRSADRPLTALLRPGAEDCEPCAESAQLQLALKADPQAMVVHNQHPAAIELVERLDVAPTRVFIEIREDTRGVLGLQAYHASNRAAQPLELLHE